jgi:glucosamine-6-phosphate deaminase
MEVVICPDYDTLSKQAAAAVAEVVRAKPDCVIGLATGSSPLGLYAELIRMHKEEGLDFSKARSFNLDEYVGLKGDHPQSYRRFMDENLFSGINIDPANTHVPSGTADDYARFCDEYEKAIADAGGIDVQVLGIGSDGHIGFNEPGTSLASRTHVTTLTEQTVDDNARFFDSKDEVPRYACTMGVGTVLETRRCVLVANGAKKVPAVSAMIEGPITAMCTASALQMHNDTQVFLDEEAAGGLKLADFYRWTQQNKADAPK